MKFKNLYLVGTSHISPESLKEVSDTIKKVNPTVVAIELDRKRLQALLTNQKKGLHVRDIKRFGLKGWLFAIIGSWVEKKLGEQVGVAPGSEMMQAFRLAQKKRIKVALIDQDIEITLRRFSKEFTCKEKWRLLVDIIKGLIFRKQAVKFDLRKVPSKKLISKMIKEVKQRYPNIYKVLIKERNDVMAKNLAKLMKLHPDDNIVAVMGAGHEDDMKRLISSYLRRLDVVKV